MRGPGAAPLSFAISLLILVAMVATSFNSGINPIKHDLYRHGAMAKQEGVGVLKVSTSTTTRK